MTGVFCLEGFWYGAFSDPTSVVDLLELVNRHNRMPYIHHRCATRAEFECSIRHWLEPRLRRKHQALYLSFHGKPGTILVGEEPVTLEELGQLLKGRCKDVVIHFGCCSTLKADPARLQRFLQQTGCLALMGYGKPVPWMASAAFELLLLEGLSQYKPEESKIRLLDRVLKSRYSSLVKALDFDIVLRRPEPALRTQKRPGPPVSRLATH